MKPLLTVGIPTWENVGQLYSTVMSLVMYTDYPLKVVIVDNGDKDWQMVQRIIEESQIGHTVQAVFPDENLGWTGGVNRAFEECDTPFFCMLNDDVLFPPGSDTFWRRLIRWFEDPKVGAVGPGSNFVAGAQNAFGLSVPPVGLTRVLIGFCMVVRTEVFREIGGLDESLPGGDDFDLSIRLGQAGHKLVFDKTVYLHHIGQQTGRRLNGDDWDSQDMQERVNNALIRKHGVEAWYEVHGMGWSQQGLGVIDTKDESQWLREALQRNVPSGSRGISLGAGARQLPDDLGLKVLSTDLARSGEEGVGGQRFKGAVVDVTMDATAPSLQDSSCDFLAALHLLEHLVDPMAALDEWKRLLRSDGCLVLTVPDQAKSNTILLDCSHVHAFVEVSLRRLLEVCGWQVLEIESVGWGALCCVAEPERVQKEALCEQA